MAYFTHMSTMVGGSFAHMSGITDLEVVTINGQARLYSASFADGGLSAFSLAEGQAAAYLDDLGAGPMRGTNGVVDLTVAVVDGQEILIPSGRYDDLVALHVLDGTGGLGDILSGNGSHADFGGFTTTEVVTTNKGTFLFASQSGKSGIKSYDFWANMALSFKAQTADSTDVFLGDVAAMVTTQIKSRDFLFVASTLDAGITSYQITSRGDTYLRDTVSPSGGGGFSLSTVLEVAKSGGRNFLLLGSAGTDSISVYNVSNREKLRETDFKQDTLLTRFDGVEAIESFTCGNRTFVPAGDDRMIDGKGKDTMKGGKGADIFVFNQDGQTDTVTDFTLGVDKLDLSDFTMLYHFSALDIVAKSWGYLITVQGEAMRLYTPDGQNNSGVVFTQDDSIF